MATYVDGLFIPYGQYYIQNPSGLPQQQPQQPPAATSMEDEFLKETIKKQM